MKLLLDTQILLWANVAPRRLGEHLSLLADEANELLVSAVVSWEIAIKYSLGKLALPDPPGRWVVDRIREIGGVPIAVEHRHALAVAELPLLHGDPFDRLLVAQAQGMDATIVTADPAVTRYDVRSLLVAG